MRTVTIICLVVSMLILGCAPRKASPIEGAWKLVYFQWVRGGTLVDEYPGKWIGSQMKIWTRGYFAWLARFKSDTTLYENYGGGRYELDGDRYEEILQYDKSTSMIGDTVKMLVKIKNDTLALTWPVGINGQIDDKNFVQEKYTRLD